MKKLLFLLVLFACTKTEQKEEELKYCWKCNTISYREQKNFVTGSAKYDTVTTNIIKCDMTEYESKIYAGHLSVDTYYSFPPVNIKYSDKCTCIKQ